jgi:hypothetical protein
LSAYPLKWAATPRERVGRYYTDEQNRGNFIICAYSFYKSDFIGGRYFTVQSTSEDFNSTNLNYISVKNVYMLGFF